MSDFGYGSYHNPYDPEKHVAFWGSRRIFAEVRDGSNGLVSDRQSVIGDVDEVNKVVAPVVRQWIEEVREQMRRDLSPSSQDVVTLVEGPVTVVGSPQGSHGYLYVSATLDKEVTE